MRLLIPVSLAAFGLTCFSFDLSSEAQVPTFPLPTGSYSLSCKNLRIDMRYVDNSTGFVGTGAVLLGQCTNRAGKTLFSALANPQWCEDVGNMDGVLTCVKWKIPDGDYRIACTNVRFLPLEGPAAPYLAADCWESPGRAKTVPTRSGIGSPFSCYTNIILRTDVYPAVIACKKNFLTLNPVGFFR